MNDNLLTEQINQIVSNYIDTCELSTRLFELVDKLNYDVFNFVSTYLYKDFGIDIVISCSRNKVNYFKLIKNLDNSSLHIDLDYNKYCYYTNYQEMIRDIELDSVNYCEWVSGCKKDAEILRNHLIDRNIKFLLNITK